MEYIFHGSVTLHYIIMYPRNVSEKYKYQSYIIILSQKKKKKVIIILYGWTINFIKGESKFTNKNTGPDNKEDPNGGATHQKM